MLLTGSGKAVCRGWRGGGRPITFHVCATLVIYVSKFATRSDAKKKLAERSSQNICYNSNFGVVSPCNSKMNERFYYPNVGQNHHSNQVANGKNRHETTVFGICIKINKKNKSKSL